MLRRQVIETRTAALALDLALAWLLFLVVTALRWGGGTPAGTTFWQPLWPWVAAFAWAGAWVLVLRVRGIDGVPVGWSWRHEATAVGTAGLLAALVVLSVLFLLRLSDVSRLFLVTLVAAQVAVTLASRRLLHAAHGRHRRGLGGRYLLIVGGDAGGAALIDRIAARPALRLEPVGRMRGPSDPPEAELHPAIAALPVLGDLRHPDDLDPILHGHVIDEVAVCLAPADAALVAAIAARCSEEGRACHVPVATLPPAIEGGVLDQLDGLAVLSVLPRPDRVAALAAKRAFDMVAASLALVLAVPLLLATGLVVRLIDGGPVLFRQRRIGRNGRPFQMLKLRTMSVDAEERRPDLAPHNEIRGSAFKLSNDPRLTRTGTFLRRTSLDELPQLWNVLRGEMSLVGPRPPLPEEVAAYAGWHRRRLSVTPGMTGLWQVEGRHHPQFDHWVRLDLAYIDRWSLRLDMVILLRTIPVILGGRGR